MRPPRPLLLALCLCAAWFLAGCAHPAPAPVALPTAAAVARPIKAAAVHVDDAAQSNARAVRLARAAVATGIRAGSDQARDLAAATQTTDAALAQVRVQLALATAAVDQLTAQLLAAQTQVDQLRRHDATQTARADRAARDLAAADTAKWHAREALAAVLIAGLVLLSLAGAEIQRLLDAAERTALHVAEALGSDAVGAVTRVSWVGALLARLAPIAALA